MGERPDNGGSPEDQLGQLVAYVRSFALKAQEGFDSIEDEWMPHAFLCMPSGDVAYSQLPPELVDSPERRVEAVRSLVVPEIRASGASEFALLLEMWGVQKPAGFGTREDAERVALESVPAALDPDREELLVVLAASAEASQTWLAPVVRSEGPPSIRPWQGPMEWVLDGGGMVALLQDALR